MSIVVVKKELWNAHYFDEKGRKQLLLSEKARKGILESHELELV